MEMHGMQVFIADYSFTSELEGSFSQADLQVSLHSSEFCMWIWQGLEAIHAAYALCDQ